MAFISETLQMRRLTESGVNIKTTYIVDGTLKYRSTDGTCQDDVHSGIRCRKEYFRQGKLLHTEKIFDSRMEYTYVSGMDEEAQHTCENCGFTGKVKEFVNGCPCCDAASNIDYADKELGSKHHYDLVLQSPVYRIVTGVVDYIISFLLCSLWIINTSRTFNGYDVSKIFIYSTILAMILYYFFYLCDAYAVLGPVRRYKEKQNRRQQEFWTGTGIDKKRFYNNLNYEAGRRYYSRPNVIDYDIMDYTGLQEHVENGILCVDVELQVRLVYLRGGRITSAYQKDTFSLSHNDRVMTMDSGIHVIKCPKCDANIDVTKGVCEYCGSEIDSLQDIPIDLTLWWSERLKENLPIILSDLDELPPEADGVKAVLAPQGIKSLMVVPLINREGTWGYIGVDIVGQYRIWNEADRQWLLSLANIISVCIEV